MKEHVPKQKRSHSLNLVWYFTALIYFFTFIACRPQRPPSRDQNDIFKKTQAINRTTVKSFSKPKLIPINKNNKPKLIKAGKPVIRVDSSNGGIPFFTNYSTDQGLPLSSIICSAIDQAGNLWFGTGGGGVSRYDGKHFTNYSRAQGLASNVVFNIMEDKAGNLWFCTTAGVSKYNGYSFTNYTKAQGLADNFVISVMQDNKGNLWFGTHEGGVSKYDGKNFTSFTTSQGLADNYILCMLMDKYGNLWFGTDAGGVSKYDGNSFINYTKNQGLVNNSVNSISQDKTGNFWFGTRGGISKYDGKKFTNFTTKQGLADNNISCILQDNEGNIWCGMQEGGVSKYDGNRFTNYSKVQGLPGNNISSILLDKSNNLWFTSRGGGGISKIESNEITYYTKYQGLSDNNIWSILQDKTANIWFGTNDEGVDKYDGKTFTNYTTAQGLAGNWVWNILEDKNGNMWFCTERNGVSKYDGKNFINYNKSQGLPSNTINCIMQDKKGNIWFGTNGGASMYDGKCFTNYTTSEGLAGNNVQYIIQDKSDNLWLGTHDDGASKYDGQTFTNYTTADGLVSNTIYIIRQDKKGNLWFGTNTGTSEFNGKTFINYTTGMGDNNIWGIAEDSIRNTIWFGTNQGLTALKEKKSYNGNKQDNEFEVFNKNTGYPIDDVSTGAVLVDNKGILWAGSGHDRLIRFDYSKVNKKITAMNLVIQNVKVNNENICWNNLIRSSQRNKPIDSLVILNEMITSFGKKLSAVVLESMSKKYRDIRLDGIMRFYPVPINLVLPYNDNNISLDFVAIEPALQKQVKYQFKLEGYNNDWSPLGNNSNAVFGNIRPGNYIFKLKALSPFGVWSEIEYSFKVLPPWWSTWWAYSLYGLISLTLFYTFYHNRIRRIKRKQAEEVNIMVTTQEEERKRISRDLHDDIGARLTNINILSALGQQKIDEPQEMSDYLHRISNEVQTSAEALDDIVWSIDTKNDSIQEVIARMRRYAADVFDKTLIRYTIIVDEKFLPAKLYIGKRRDLFLVFKETINNIQKHAMATEVKINIEAKDNNLLMQVNDNGKGFDTERPTHRNGLKNIQQRMEKWGGTFMVQSSPGKGARMKISLPVSHPSLKRGI